MRSKVMIVATCAVLMGLNPGASARQGTAATSQGTAEMVADPTKILVDRLDLERYKATIKELTQFGDRRQGTDRNRHAIDWIETQLKSYNCTNTERLKYDYQPAGPDTRKSLPYTAVGPGLPTPPDAISVGGGRPRGLRTLVGVNNDPSAQPDPKIRALDSQPSSPGAREEVYCTKVGTTHPDEMYIVSGHMDGIGWGEAANDDGSGTALVMELARVEQFGRTD